MKSPFRYSIFIAFGSIFLVAIILNFSFTQAQDGQIDLESQMSSLIEQMSQSNELIHQLLIEKSPLHAFNLEPADDLIPPPDPAFVDMGDIQLSQCITSDYLNWPSSTDYKNFPWAPWFMRLDYMSPHTDNFELMQDLNGDGLVDYTFVHNSGAQKQSCTYLNNGSGWDLASRCVVNGGIAYGDCADV